MSDRQIDRECSLRSASSHSARQRDLFAYEGEENADVKRVLRYMKPLLFFEVANGEQIGISVNVRTVKRWIRCALDTNDTRRISSGDSSVLKIQQANPKHDDWIEFQIRMRGKVYETGALTGKEFSEFKSKRRKKGASV